MDKRGDTHRYPVGYHNLVLTCVAIVQVILILLFKFWPVSHSEPKFQISQVSEQPVTMNLVEVTHQGGSSTPPNPVVPVEVPSDKIIPDPLTHVQTENLIKGDTLGIGTMPGSGSGTGAGQGSGNAIVSNPDMPPSIVKIVEPAIPNQARDAKVKAEVFVNFLVGKNGLPEDVSIAKIRVYDENQDKWKVVPTIGYGIIDATLEAAAQWRFRPAKNKGKVVRAYTQHIFTFGV